MVDSILLKTDFVVPDVSVSKCKNETLLLPLSFRNVNENSNKSCLFKDYHMPTIVSTKLRTGYSLSDQHILSRINPKWKYDFFRLTKIYSYCSEIEILQNLCFEFQNNLCILG